MKDIKNFLKKKKTKGKKKTQERYQNFTEEEKESRCECYQERKRPKYRRNYYLTHLTHKS